MLENDACNISYGFDLKNKIDLIAVNALMCFWANTSLSNITVELDNGKTIDISDLDLTNKKDIKKLAL